MDADAWPCARPAPPWPVLSLLVAVVLTLLAGLLTPASPAAAVDPTPTPLVTGWLPSWATDTALAGVEANADLIGEASPVLVHRQGIGRRRERHDGRGPRRDRQGHGQPARTGHRRACPPSPTGPRPGPWLRCSRTRRPGRPTSTSSWSWSWPTATTGSSWTTRSSRSRTAPRHGPRPGRRGSHSSPSWARPCTVPASSWRWRFRRCTTAPTPRAAGTGSTTTPASRRRSTPCAS